MRILFCDDDKAILSLLQQYVSEFFHTLGGTQPDYAVYDNGEDLLQHEDRADIAFLDVEMPGTSGISIGAKLKEKNPRIKIFIVTAYPDYLDEAMRFQVFRYLSKPIDKYSLFRNLKDAVYAYNIESCEFPISTSEGVFVRKSEEILCVETSQRKTIVHTTDGDFISTKNIEYWRQTLTLPCFYSTHRSFVVNMHFVYSIGKDTVTLKNNNQEITVFLSRRKYSQFKDAYLMYMESTR